MAIEGRQLKFTDYEGFTEKFKPKKTTDDCYTPQPMYDALGEWLRENCAEIANATQWVRPFYPGGDYEAFDYPEGCAVVDNPPFSILAQICRFYNRHGIKYWLFAPTLTLFGLVRTGATCVHCGVSVTYANGAVVNTSFVTNCWRTDCHAVMCGSLYKAIEAEEQQRKKETKKQTNTIVWPDEITSAALLQKVIKGGEDFAFPKGRCNFVGELDNRQQIFGGGLMLSKGLAAELRAAELRAAAKPMFSARELAMIELLSKND